MPSHLPIVRHAGEGETNDAFQLRRRFLLTAVETGGAFSLWEEAVPPGAGPPLHRHLREQETFQVLAGRVLFQCGDQRVEVTPGAVVLVPAGAPHAFRNVGDDPARLAVTMTPGGFEGFFREVEAAGLAPPQDMARIADLAARYGLVFDGPPIEA